MNKCNVNAICEPLHQKHYKTFLTCKKLLKHKLCHRVHQDHRE